MKSAILLAIILLLAIPAHAQQRPGTQTRPTPAQSQPAPAAPAPQGTAPCECEHIAALQQELRNAITLRDRHQAMADQLTQRYGQDPHDSDLSAARREYEAFETGKGPTSAARGIAATVPDAPQAISYIPFGQTLLDAHASDDRNGIPQATRDRPDGVREPDEALRRKIEAEYHAKGQDLCEFANRPALERAARGGAVCAGIFRAVVAHEEGHRDTCRKTRFYDFVNRKPAALARDEVAAYGVQIALLVAELHRALGLKNTRILSGATGDIEAMLAVKSRCALAVNVAGQIDELSLKARVCDTAETFSLTTSPPSKWVMTPKDRLSGTYAYDGTVGGAGRFYGSGAYTIQLDANGTGTLTMDGAGRWWATNPVGTASKGGPERLRATEIKGGC